MDYSPSLVMVREDLIRTQGRPGSLGGMPPLLAGTSLSGNLCRSIGFLVAMNVLNYQFWDVTPEGEFIRYRHGVLEGAYALQAAFTQAWLRNAPLEPMSDDLYFHHVIGGLQKELSGADGVKQLFGDIPNPTSRAALLREVLNPVRLAIVAQYLAARVSREGQLDYGDAIGLAHQFPDCYDEPYLKKAQLTLMFIAAEWRARPDAPQLRLDISAAADYQLPKVLRAMGLLQYSPAVAALVDNGTLIEKNSDVENAIRAATVLACFDLAQHFGKGVEQVDFWIWLQRNTATSALFHRTRTTDY